jgi:hypothetical protein
MENIKEAHTFFKILLGTIPAKMFENNLPEER